MRARDILSGRKIDSEKGCVIKAEMAKKNLHTKRGLNTADPKYSINFRRRGLPDQQYYKGLNGDYSQYENSINYGSEYYPMQTPMFHNQYLDNADIFDPFGPSNAALEDLNLQEQFYASDTCLSPTEDYDPKLPLFGTSQSSRGFSSVLYNSDELLSKSLGTMSMNDFPGSDSFGGRSSSFSYSTPHPGADQNPPCNTLYVGNLPNESCEEELRHLFQCCPGYKRLCFKTRINGPMCFVEVYYFN